MSILADPKDVLHAPASGRFILFSLIAAFLLYLLPASGSLVFLRVEWPLLVLLYWAIHQPNRVGFAVGFVLGLLVDVSDGNILGQHAIAYTLAVYLAMALRLRILKFRLWQQALHILAFLLLSQILVALTHLFLPSTFPGIGYFAASFIGALLWPVVTFVLEYPQLLAARSGND
jgi:rod shape-determining protein MreD